jgi:hypothetical protein
MELSIFDEIKLAQLFIKTNLPVLKLAKLKLFQIYSCIKVEFGNFKLAELKFTEITLSDFKLAKFKLAKFLLF